LIVAAEPKLLKHQRGKYYQSMRSWRMKYNVYFTGELQQGRV